ncbi:receptor-type tyrosine-protein phosphatase epsilon-like [Haliotis rubra]|uniref:receptor-type tyrosine-protein phosphatase epsilon-like n=1 Tax=Haliotis rubra TaxID=36100 RepID=UPI001EE5477F|nr:receptor-type tyrosine-protein phosphatase epsilon-like [Haliotis rubra]
MKSTVEEFYRLPEGFVHSYSESQHPRNKGKNRFKGYYPYDYNRVVLHDGSESTRGDYINASYIDGYKAEKRYIAAQGPYRPEVVVDFWRMIYKEHCATVVMLTELVETGKMKCLQYWPKQGSLQFGDITVTMETEAGLANYKITKLSLQNEKEAKVRHLNHFQFTGWPDNDAPDTSAFLEFMWRVKGSSGGLEHPIVIHCSAGVGRTGTYIAIESLVEQVAVESKADVVSFISSMRGQRKNMIRTKEQYMFLHQVVDMAVSEGDTSLDSDMIIQTDLSHVSEVTMGNKNVQQHLEVLEKESEEGFKRDPVTTLSSHKSKNGFVVLSSQDKEEEWSQVYKSDSRILITWAADKPVYLPSNDSPITTARIEACMRGSTVIPDDVLLNTVELTAEDADGSALIQHYHLTGSIRNQSVNLLIDSLLTRLNDQQQCSCTVVSHSVGEARLLILLMNIASRLMDDGRVDVIRNMRRLQSSLGGPPFGEEDVCLCLEFAQRRLESSVSVNV